MKNEENVSYINRKDRAEAEKRQAETNRKASIKLREYASFGKTALIGGFALGVAVGVSSMILGEDV